VRDSDSLLHAFRRLEIEAALSLKHLRIWNTVLESDAMGAIVLEDDFYLRRESSPVDVASLIREGFPDHDLIDLAGGLTRESLGLPESQGQDLSLPFLVANTTCAYFISRRACQALVEMVAADNELLYLAPDFLITELNVTDFTGSTLLPCDLPLVHGSRDGTVESSIPY
jgi:GR25 family glycosyltransferase involved in LPS biosynthesis